MGHGIRNVKDWPKCLEQLSADELHIEREYWLRVSKVADDVDSRKAAERRVQDVGREIYNRS